MICALLLSSRLLGTSGTTHPFANVTFTLLLVQVYACSSVVLLYIQTISAFVVLYIKYHKVQIVGGCC